jgi:L-threonylcarbamoyladenylate synthase
VLKVYETKGRPRFNPLIVHCADTEMAASLVDVPDSASPFLPFWPGPLTLVLPLKPRAPVADLVTAGLKTLAVRVPAHPLARDLIRAAGRPLAAPSANLSGCLSPTRAEHVLDAFSGAVPVLDGGPCEAGLESTILAFDGEIVVQLRPGAISRDVLQQATGVRIGNAEPNGPISAPGMLKSHYAPRAALRLNAIAPETGQAFLAFGPGAPAAARQLNLSVSGDLREAARNLFSYLDRLDRDGATTIAVAPIPLEGLGEAINDRLQRAAAPKVSL